MLDSDSKINVINFAFIEKLDLKIWKTNVKAQKIDGSALKTFGLVIADFQIEDKGGKFEYFQEIFLVADTKFEVILGISFLKLSNADVLFDKRTLMWKSYITHAVLIITEQVQLSNLQKFIIAALDVDSKTFVMHMATREWKEMPVHSKRQAKGWSLTIWQSFH